jgi:hypothetical protein
MNAAADGTAETEIRIQKLFAASAGAHYGGALKNDGRQNA